MTALLLLLPSTPMLFQGQEFCASAPFLYFADFDRELGDAIRSGRAEFLTQFPSVASYLAAARLDDPASPETFERCRLDLTERERHAAWYRLHEDLLRLRREDPVLNRQAADGLDGAVLSPSAFALRFFGPDHGSDRLLIVNLGGTLSSDSFAEPLIAPPRACGWTIAWASEDPRYGGTGMPDPWPLGRWQIPGDCAFLARPGEPPRVDRTGVRRRTA
jgi:maltooligosyltrehalose trehalohydrolase